MGQQEEMTALGIVELQSLGDFEEKALRDLDIAALLEPCVPRESDAGERSHFLAPEARRAAPAGGWQPDIGRGELLPMVRDEVGKITSCARQAATRQDYRS